MGDSDPSSTAVWRSALPTAVPSAERAWLEHPGSLSARLRALGRFSVSVIREGHDQADREDADVLSLRIGAAIWRRDVVLLVEDEPVVVAHSIAPLAESTNNWSALRALGRQPLADLLYDDPLVTRSPILYRPLGFADPLFDQAADAWPALSVPQLWARRSVFVRRRAPLAVAECFLPTLWVKAGADRS